MNNKSSNIQEAINSNPLAQAAFEKTKARLEALRVASSELSLPLEKIAEELGLAALDSLPEEDAIRLQQQVELYVGLKNA